MHPAKREEGVCVTDPKPDTRDGRPVRSAGLEPRHEPGVRPRAPVGGKVDDGRLAEHLDESRGQGVILPPDPVGKVALLVPG